MVLGGLYICALPLFVVQILQNFVSCCVFGFKGEVNSIFALFTFKCLEIENSMKL